MILSPFTTMAIKIIIIIEVIVPYPVLKFHHLVSSVAVPGHALALVQTQDEIDTDQE